MITADEITHTGVEIVKNALIDYLDELGVRSLTVNHFSDGPQIRFAAEVGGETQLFGVDVEPFLPVGGELPHT